MILYPPIIAGELPPIIETANGSSSNYTINIPFEKNRAVSSYSGISMIIKTIPTNDLVGAPIKTTTFEGDVAVFEFNSTIAKLSKGNSYKILLAFVDSNNEVGYYSTPGIAYCTTMPEVTIDGFSNVEDTYNAPRQIVGKVVFTDITDSLVSSECIIKDSNENIVFSSGQIFHDNSRQESSEIIKCNYNYKTHLVHPPLYKIQYFIKTNHGIEAASAEFKIEKKSGSVPLVHIESELKNEEGCFYIKLIKNGESVQGHDYLLSKLSSKDNYNILEEICEVNIKSTDFPTDLPCIIIYKDYDIEHGVEYKYRIEQKPVQSSSFLFEETTAQNAYFEDTFLFDGEKQLKLKFNPEISSFKTNVTENKIDTIGGQYPIFFRNGDSNYKEFPISGLISCLMDDQKMFASFILDQDGSRTGTPQTNELEFNQSRTDLTDINISNEKKFKLLILDWLNNGKEKLFKSPTEGNYVVRLMNVGLTPKNELGRMLHSFSCTAYEVSNELKFEKKALKEQVSS